MLFQHLLGQHFAGTTAFTEGESSSNIAEMIEELTQLEDIEILKIST